MGSSIGIIGAGVTGLIAGCYARMNGYDATLFEAHSLPGGLCTSWKKGDHYTIDGCIQWLVGVSPESGFHRGWLEVGALQGKTIIHQPIFTTYENPDGRKLNLYTDVDLLEQHLLQFSPPDAPLIRRLCADIRLLARLDRKELHIGDWFKLPLHLFNLGKMILTPMSKFGPKFKDPLLKEAFGLSAGLPDFPILIYLLTMAWHHNRNGGYPLGGSLVFSKSIEKRLRDLGGVIHYQARVERILVREGRAVGVKLADGSEHFFDRVISAADGHLTFDHLLEGKYNSEKTRRAFDKLKPFDSMVLVNFGVRRDMSKEPRSLFLGLKEPLTVGGRTQKRLLMHHYAYDPSLAPPGCTVIQVGFQADYDYWSKLHQDPARYEAEKHSVAKKVLGLLEIRFPGIGGQVEVTDVATPTTFERYTGNWRGSIEGWLPTLGAMLRPMPKTLKRLKGLYLAGQWVQPGGGLPTCLMTGKGILQKICKEDGKEFETSLPP